MNSRLLCKLFLTVFIFLVLFENGAPAAEVIPPKKDSLVQKEEDVEISGRADCPGFCTTLYDPVCGDDGVQYSNRCFFEQSKCNGGTGVHATNGPCPMEDWPSGNKYRPGGNKYRPAGNQNAGGIFQFLCYECHVYIQSQTGSGVGIEQIHGGKG